MSKRIIECTVTDEYVNGAGVVVGAAESHNDVVLRLKFSPLWDGLSKHITWLDAKGENPTIVYLTSDLIPSDDITVYDVPIPAEAKKYAGEIEMSIRGVTTSSSGGYTVTDRATMSARAVFEVLESVYDSNAETGSDPTATIAEQLQGQIDKVLSDINKAGQAAEKAEACSAAAAVSESNAKSSEISAASSASAALKSEAAASASEAASAINKADSLEASAAAEKSKNAAAASANTAKASETASKLSADSASEYKTSAENAAAAALSSASEATTKASEALNSANKSAVSADEAALSAASAAADAEAAEAAKEYVASKPIPTKTSELINDSGYVTAAEVPEGSTASTTLPKMDGTATVGTETAFARGDHIHPKDDTKIDKVTSAVSGNIAIFGADGALADGGLKFSIVNGGLRVTYDNGL